MKIELSWETVLFILLGIHVFYVLLFLEDINKMELLRAFIDLPIHKLNAMARAARPQRVQFYDDATN